jgi:hypothetical protein
VSRETIGAVLDGTAFVALLAGILAGGLGLVILLFVLGWRR